MADPAGRFSIAFDDPTLEWAPTWTALDQTYPNLVVSYTIDRGRQYELDRTDTGRAVVSVADRDGILDPTNTGGPYYTKIEPLLQAAIARWNPVASEWQTRFRGFIEDYDYVFDPSQRVNRLVVSLVDIFEIVSRVEMHPALFGSGTPPAESDGQVYFQAEDVDDRINFVLDEAMIPIGFRVVFTGNVGLHAAVYSAGESAMTAVQEAADAEFPGVSNVYADRLGRQRLCFHGRLAKFDPAGTASGASPGAWDYQTWKVGDGIAVAASATDTAQIRAFSFNRGLSKVINQALATPQGIADADMSGTPTSIGSGLTAAGQLVYDTASQDQFGIRAWSAQNLLTKVSHLDSSDDLTETRRFAAFYVQNFAEPKNRVTSISVRAMTPSHVGAAANWKLLSEIDIADSVAVTIDSPGGGGFNLEPFFVEGVHETVEPLNPSYDDVTVSLDLSPQAFFTSDPWPDT